MYDPLKAKMKVALYAGLAFLMGLGMASGLGWTDASVAMPVIDDRPQVSQGAVRTALSLSDAFVEIADVVTPAVVRIQARRPAPVAREQVPDPFQRFFGPEGPGRLPDPGPQLGSGSGFIVSEDGYILTNHHVVDGSDQITVFLTDRRYFSATLVGADPFTDVAVIKIQSDEAFPTLSFGNSDEIRVGEWVVAIGNPGFGAGSLLDYTVTAGIVSARGRGLNLLNNELRRELADPTLSAYAIEDFIQTDAVINPGNSGGPMVDLQGRVVGINSAIATSSGFYQGYGFAVPINLARRVMEDLVEYGHVRRPRLGVSIEDVTADDADVYGLPRIGGAVIQRVDAGTPAARAGLQPQDVIVAVEGRPVGYSNQLQQRIAEYRPGDRITVTVYRDGAPRDFEAVLGEAPINELPQETVAASAPPEQRLGITVDRLDESNYRDFGFAEPGGVVITGVERTSPAALRVIVPGTKIVAINETEVETPEEVRTLLAEATPGEVVTLHLLDRLGTARFVNLRVPMN